MNPSIPAISATDAAIHPGRRAVFVTGAANGIGRACAELFAQQGWFVGLYDINEKGVAAIAASLGKGNATCGALDVASATAWQQALADFWEQSGGRLDVLINNAGILSAGPFAETPLSKHSAMLAVNVEGVINGCHCAFNYLRRTPGAHVINMASATAIYGQPDLATYSATKFAVRGLTEALDLEWRTCDVRVSAIWPSFVRTAMADGFAHMASAKSLGIRLTPADVALTVWACATEKQRIHRTHRTVGLQAGLLSLATRLTPSAISRWVVQRIAR